MKRKTLTVTLALAVMALALTPALARAPVSDNARAEAVNQATLPTLPIRRPAEYPNLAKETEQAANLKTLSAAIKVAGLEEALAAKGTYTLFAPTDEAFAKMDKAQLDALFQDPARMRAFLLKHVVIGKITSRDLALRSAVRDAAGNMHPVNTSGRALHVDGAKVIKTDQQASNGMLHQVDTVLAPVA